MLKNIDPLLGPDLPKVTCEAIERFAACERVRRAVPTAVFEVRRTEIAR